MSSLPPTKTIEGKLQQGSSNFDNIWIPAFAGMTFADNMRDNMTVASAASSIPFQCLMPQTASPFARSFFTLLSDEVADGKRTDRVWNGTPSGLLTYIIGTYPTPYGPNRDLWCARAHDLISKAGDWAEEDLATPLQTFMDAYERDGLELEPIPQIARTNEIISGAEIYLQKALGEALQIGQEMGWIKELKEDPDNEGLWHRYVDWLERCGNPRADVFYHQMHQERLKQDLIKMITDKLRDKLKGDGCLREVELAWEDGSLCGARLIDEKGEAYQVISERKLLMTLNAEDRIEARWFMNHSSRDVTRKMILRELVKAGVAGEQSKMRIYWENEPEFKLQPVMKIVVDDEGARRTIYEKELWELLSSSLIGRYYFAEIGYEDMMIEPENQFLSALVADFRDLGIIFPLFDFSWRGDFITEAGLSIDDDEEIYFDAHNVTTVLDRMFQSRECALLRKLTLCDVDQGELQAVLNYPKLKDLAELTIRGGRLSADDVEALIAFASDHEHIELSLEENDLSLRDVVVLMRGTKDSSNVEIIPSSGRNVLLNWLNEQGRLYEGPLPPSDEEMEQQHNDVEQMEIEAANRLFAAVFPDGLPEP